MATRQEERVVNLAGLAQGVTLVTFPAASSILTDPDRYDLSGTQYGAMFLPQVATAITTSLLGSRLAARLSPKTVLLLGLAANLAAMVILVLTTLVETDQSVAYPLLLVATACLGTGFGLTVPILNTYVSAFHPDRADKAVLVLNALLGLGTALAPVFVAVFLGLGIWWGLPALAAAALAVLLLGCLRLPLQTGITGDEGRSRASGGIPSRFWILALFALLYGLCETMNGNWSQVDMQTRLGATTTEASIALATFWAAVTAGRVIFAAIVRWVPAAAVHHLLPVVLVVTFLVIAALPDDRPWLGVAAFGLAGLGCSALLPLTISLGQDRLPEFSAAVAGGVIAAYQVGYGIAAFGVGPLVDHGVGLGTVYAWTAVAAGAMVLLSFPVTRSRTELAGVRSS
ncbi:MAG TPA: MFS transporter [Nocardioides sp.]|nr:MFS transporter [Nocardioides sp.]